ncbi:transposase [Saccharopolyspora sp. NPDC000995]
MSQAGAVLLLRTAETVGVTSGLSEALSPWRKPLAVHDLGKIVLDLAIAVAVGGDCLADIALVRTEAGVFGSVASDPTVSRLITELAVDAGKAVSSSSLAGVSPVRVAARRSGSRLAASVGNVRRRSPVSKALEGEATERSVA